jgi:hypothetical protein
MLGGNPHMAGNVMASNTIAQADNLLGRGLGFRSNIKIGPILAADHAIWSNTKSTESF